MKKIKFLIVLTLAFGVVSLSSCKKDKKVEVVTPSATITADIDGVTTTFNTGAIAIKSTIDGQPFVEVDGTGANSTLMSISIRHGDIIAGKTYTSVPKNGQDIPIIYYSTTDDKFYNDDSTNIISVTVTSISSTSIQGTFSGKVTNTLINPQNHAPITKVITNGKFNVEFYQNQQ